MLMSMILKSPKSAMLIIESAISMISWGFQQRKKPPPEKETAFFMPCGYVGLGAFTLEGESSNAEEHEKPTRRFRDGSPVRGVLRGRLLIAESECC